MVGRNILGPHVYNLSTEDAPDRSDSVAEMQDQTAVASACCAPSGADAASIAGTFEDNALDDVPQEVVSMIGAYDTDCAGGCG